MSFIATTPQPPYYAVIFTTQKSTQLQGYEQTAARMFTLAAEQPGYLGHESLGDGPHSITVSYWKDLKSIRAWREQTEHKEARRHGRERWYDSYCLRVCRVERDKKSAED